MLNKRYIKQLHIPCIGDDGQRKLGACRAVVVGAGGLGSPVIYYLAAAGIGNIHIVDADHVEESNFNRQLLHFENDIGTSKVLSAKHKIGLFNSDINVTVNNAKVTSENAQSIINEADIILSCVDNIETRYVLNAACVAGNIPMIDGGVNAFDGYVMTIIPKVTPCYNCIYGNLKQAALETNTLGSVAGVVGSIMATQAIKTLLGVRNEQNLIYIDLKSNSFQTINAPFNSSCGVCGAI